MLNTEMIADLLNPDPAQGRDRMLVGTGATAPLPDMSFRWATVVNAAATPLQVTFDGDADPVPVSARLTPVQSGQRVWCQLFGRRVIILGSPSAGASAAGSANVTHETAETTVSVTVTFPAGTFPTGSAPILTATMRNTVPDAFSVGVSSATATSGTVYVYRRSIGTAAFNWHAILP